MISKFTNEIKCEIINNTVIFAIMYYSDDNDSHGEPKLEVRSFKMGYYDRYIVILEDNTEIVDLGISVNADVYENGELSIKCTSTVIKTIKKEAEHA